MPRRKRGKMVKKAPVESAGRSIDTLPDGVLQHIIGFLPARDAVRTCVLARRWRDLWMFATGLRIISNCDDDVAELREFVDHLLLTRGIAPLETFELRFDGISADDFCEGDVLRVNLWCRHAIRCQVRALRFLFSQCDFPFELCDLHLVSRHLVKLELAGLVVMEDFLDLTSCPALEQLEIENCDLCLAKKISYESLKHLIITACEFSYYARARIHAPSLVSLLLDGNLLSTPVLESMPSLVDGSIRIVENHMDTCVCCNSIDGSCQVTIPGNCTCILLEGLSEAKNLALIAESETFIFKKDLRQCPTFSKLKTLLLSDYLCVALDLDAITCILKHSPVLERLTLELFRQGSGHKMLMKGSYSPVHTAAAISEHLKIVEVKCEVFDERVYKVLKLLCTFNIRKLINNAIEIFQYF
ncbi:hypothetical protein HU200_024179 [Digitaria exilis]|uniref:F-box domain-containing protein n=1 Tax=Digitaria exilis TaxID=1010633 RepID=A0A835C447_9POAL|nr:hypothetical protein HU200_024179 [Digitaria exilis]